MADRTVVAFWSYLGELEAKLRETLPGLAIHNGSDMKDPRQRAVLGWDGMRIIWQRSAVSPPGTTPAPLNAEELHKALERFTAAAQGVIALYGLAEPPPPPAAA